MYNIYATKLQKQYSIDSQRSLKNNPPPLDGASNGSHSRAKNESFLVPHEESPVSSPGKVNSLNDFKLTIVYYNK